MGDLVPGIGTEKGKAVDCDTTSLNGGRGRTDRRYIFNFFKTYRATSRSTSRLIVIPSTILSKEVSYLTSPNANHQCLQSVLLYSHKLRQLQLHQLHLLNKYCYNYYDTYLYNASPQQEIITAMAIDCICIGTVYLLPISAINGGRLHMPPGCHWPFGALRSDASHTDVRISFLLPRDGRNERSVVFQIIFGQWRRRTAGRQWIDVDVCVYHSRTRK